MFLDWNLFFYKKLSSPIETFFFFFLYKKLCSSIETLFHPVSLILAILSLTSILLVLSS